HASGKLRGGELLTITSATAPEFNTMLQVQADGTISVPSVGEIKAKGMTMDQLQREINRLSSAHPLPKDASIAVQAPQGSLRFSGGGAYAGVIVALIALWAALQSFRRNDSLFTLPERKLMW